MSENINNPSCPEVLPFSEVDPAHVAELAEMFLYSNQGLPGYTLEIAQREAETFCTYDRAVAEGFLVETGQVDLRGVSFYLGPKTEKLWYRSFSE